MTVLGLLLFGGGVLLATLAQLRISNTHASRRLSWWRDPPAALGARILRALGAGAIIAGVPAVTAATGWPWWSVAVVAPAAFIPGFAVIARHNHRLHAATPPPTA
ncbi:hypothetical protein [Georgenia deserti]|uniref:DUF3784 domain-containing protein n=1 Tax=Georgenia deserti TaxID=2093781 RepID=A0ABW4L425_9MICO